MLIGAALAIRMPGAVPQAPWRPGRRQDKVRLHCLWMIDYDH